MSEVKEPEKETAGQPADVQAATEPEREVAHPHFVLDVQSVRQVIATRVEEAEKYG